MFVCALALPLTALAEEPLHQGWHWGAAAVVHTFYLDQNDDDDQNPPLGLGGGINLWSGYRGARRWEGRLNLNVAGIDVKKQNQFSGQVSPDASIGISIEPVFHFRKNPKQWDPYLILPEAGFLHMFRNRASGPTIGFFPTLGLQIHLSDRTSLDIAWKMQWGFMLFRDGGSVSVSGFFPIGLTFRF